ELLEDAGRLERLADALKDIPDVPRLLGRISSGSSTPRDLQALAEGLVRAADLSALLPAVRAPLLREGGEAAVSPFPSAVGTLVRGRLVPDPPLSVREGGAFRDGVDPSLDELRALRRSSAAILTSLEEKERRERAIPTLRVKFNQVFGHVFEVPGSARARI